MLCSKFKLIPIKIIFLQNFKVAQKLGQSLCIFIMLSRPIHVLMLTCTDIIYSTCICINDFLFYSLRTLCRALSYAFKNTFKNIRRSIYEV